MQVVYEKPNVVVGWDEEAGCSYIRWQGFIYGDDYKMSMNQTLKVRTEKKSSKELVNLVKARLLNQEDQKWFNEDWLPRARATGLKHTAIILPKSELAKMSLSSTMKDVESDTYGYFDNEEEARAWLKGL